MEWTERVAWEHRSEDFTRLIEYDRRVVMVFEPHNSGPPEGWQEAWRHLPAHPNLLEVAATYESHAQLLRYAALDWQHDTATGSRAAKTAWALQIASAFLHVMQHVSKHQRGYFLDPFVGFDIGAHARVGFRPPPRALTHSRWRFRRTTSAVADEVDLVAAAGRLLGSVLGPGSHLETVIGRCTTDDPRRRLPGLRELVAELGGEEARARSTRSDEVLLTWQACEEGMGWLAVGNVANARRSFRKALDRDAYRDIWTWGLAHTSRWLGTEPPVRWREAHVLPVAPGTARGPGRAPPRIRWQDAEQRGVQLEHERAFADALGVYRQALPDPKIDVARFTAMARCFMQLDQHGSAIDCAESALALDPDHLPALALLISAMLAKYQHEEALRNADRLVELTPDSARAHYLRGKALFVNGRLPEARDAFEHATKLDPKLLEAQLLRREVERVTGNVRQSVGAQHAPTFDLPEHLAELRDVLVSGNTASAIDALRDPRYAQDADAQLLLARFLAFDRRHEEALAVYDGLAATSHRTAALVGKGLALLELDRLGDALSILEQLPDDADAAEGAARALEALGRIDEAAEAYRRFIALASSGSDLRVRAAQLWLADRASTR